MYSDDDLDEFVENGITVRTFMLLLNRDGIRVVPASHVRPGEVIMDRTRIVFKSNPLGYVTEYQWR